MKPIDILLSAQMNLLRRLLAFIFSNFDLPYVQVCACQPDLCCLVPRPGHSHLQYYRYRTTFDRFQRTPAVFGGVNGLGTQLTR